ncbi:MAG: LPXTG cell wall anchor domain-containing protein [Alkalilacustris sp.]
MVRDQTGAVSSDLIVLLIGLVLVGGATLVLLREPAGRDGGEAAEGVSGAGETASD